MVRANVAAFSRSGLEPGAGNGEVTPLRALASACFLLALLAAVEASGAERRTVPVPPSERDSTVPSPITDRFHVRASYFSASADTEVRLDPSPLVAGTLVSAEDDLGLDDQLDQGRVELMFRLRERNRIRMDFFKLDRYGDTVLDQQVVFGDEVFNINDRVVSRLDLRMLGFTHAYSFVRSERLELGAGLGIHLVETEARGEVPARFLREEEAQGGALPSAAVDFTWRISRRFALAARGQYFGASVDEFDGSFTDYHADLQFRWRPNLAFGIGYSAIALELDVSDADSPGRFDLTTAGPELFFRVSY
ncbi:MAG TPA: hypothetical protein VJ011_03360 [Steroidobacteraceae bacterium]|nr:hypothetical protein [Steroidobacteraceae bacterium]